jgi:hypothetical protein
MIKAVKKCKFTEVIRSSECGTNEFRKTKIENNIVPQKPGELKYKKKTQKKNKPTR